MDLCKGEKHSVLDHPKAQEEGFHELAGGGAACGGGGGDSDAGGIPCK